MSKTYSIFLFSILYSLFSILNSSTCHAAGISLSPAFQEIDSVASSSTQPQAKIIFSNRTTSPANLEFSLVSIISTDLLGRFQFNAPLPQTINATGFNIATIDPPSATLNPEDSITVQVNFDPSPLKPGTNGFLLLAKLTSPNGDAGIQGLTRAALPRRQAGGPHEVGASTSNTDPKSSITSSQEINQYIAATILVNSKGGDRIDLQFITSDIFNFPIRFTQPDFVTLTLKNQGNTHTIPRGLVRVTDQFGRELMRGVVNEKSATVLPGSQRVIYAGLSPTHPSWPISINKFQLNGYDENHQNNFALSRYFLYINPLILLLIPIFMILKIGLKKFNPTNPHN